MESKKNISRRNFIQGSIYSTAAAMISLNSIQGCTSLPPDRSLKINYDNGINLINCNILDVINGKILKNKTIKIREGKIVRIIDPEQFKYGDAIEIDTRNNYIIPGLIDAHCHLTMPSVGEFHVMDFLLYFNQIKRNCIEQLYNGVTTVRDVGALPGALKYLLKEIEYKRLPGPRVVYCNAITNIYKSHPDISQSDVSIFALPGKFIAGDISLWYKDTTDLMNKLKANTQQNESFIKLTMDDVSIICGKGRLPVYSNEHLNLIFRYAYKHNLPVAGHIQSKFGFDRALKFNINTMEHSICDAYLSDQEIFEMVSKKIANVPTFVVDQIYATEEAFDSIPDEYRNDLIDSILKDRREFIYSKQDRYVESKIHDTNINYLKNYKKFGCNNLYKNGRFCAKPEIFFNALKYAPDNLKKMNQAGVLIGCGTDSGVPFMYHGAMLWREIELFTKIGFTNAEAIRTATINNAKILNLSDKIGSIEKGKIADMVVYNKNPLIDISTIKDPIAVFQNGNIVYFNKKLNKG